MESGFGGSAPPVVINDYKEDGELAAAVEFPPGFRFHPTDEEIIMHYLSKKVVDRRFSARAIGEADLNKCEPWDLPKKAKMGEKEWFFFCKRDRKYTTGMRTNRATELGYWKATGKDKEIYKGGNNLVGMKKTLVFYKGRAPKGGKTNWVMHEFRLQGNFSNCNSSKAANEEWVVCRVSHKNTAEIRRSPGMELAGIESFVDHLLDSPCTLPTSTDSSFAADNHQDDELKEKFTSQPRLVLDDHKSQILQYNQQHQRNFLVRSQNHNAGNATSNPLSTTHDIGQENLVFFLINSGFPHEASSSASSIGCPHQDGQSSVVSSIPPNTFPFKGADQANLMLMAPEMEHFSCDNSMISHSQDTGLSAENMANEMTSEHYVERNQPFDQQLQRLSFSSNISDLDSLWSN